MNKLHIKWSKKILKGEIIDITDLYEFSTIKLKRKRIRKKFHKNWEKYVPKNIADTYKGIIISKPLIDACMINLDISTVKPFSTPKCKLFYIDYKYENKNEMRKMKLKSIEENIKRIK